MSKIDHSEAEAQGQPSVLFFGRKDCHGTARILRHLSRCHVDVTYVESGRRGERLPEEVHEWRGDYILSFRSLFILPKKLIEQAGIAAINFHPGPPEYPGSGCINFALYEGCTQYGVTAHIMSEKVDDGQILDVRTFPVHESDTLQSVLDRTHAELEGLCLDFITRIANLGREFIEESLVAGSRYTWSGEARRLKELEDLEHVSLDVSKRQLERIIRATCIGRFSPRIILHGHEFILSPSSRPSEE